MPGAPFNHFNPLSHPRQIVVTVILPVSADRVLTVIIHSETAGLDTDDQRSCPGAPPGRRIARQGQAAVGVV